MISESCNTEGKVFFFGLSNKENLIFKSKLEDAGLQVQLISTNGQTEDWFRNMAPDLILFDPGMDINLHKGWREEMQGIATTVGIPFLPIQNKSTVIDGSNTSLIDHPIDVAFIKLQLVQHKEQKRILELQKRLSVVEDQQLLHTDPSSISMPYFDQLFFSSSISTIVFDPEGWALRVNQRFSELFGIEASHIEGRKYNLFLDSALKLNGYLEGIREVFEFQRKGEWDIVYDIGLSAESQNLIVKNKCVKVFKTWAFPIKNQKGQLLNVVIQHLDISELRQKDSSLLLHRKILENLAEGVSLTRSEDGVIVFTNPTFEQIFGYEVGELVGKHVSCLNASSERSGAEVAEAIMKSLHKHGSWNGELRNVRKDGTLFWSMANITAFDHPEFGHVWVTVQQEITNRIEAEMALRKAEFENRTILNTFPHLMFRMDREGIIFDFRAPDTSLLLMPPEHFLGKNYREVLPTEVSQKLSENFEEAFLQMHVVNIEYSLLLNSQEMFFEGRAIPISEGELLLFVHDVSEAKRVKDAIRDNEERYNLIIQATKDGVWDWDIAKDLAYVSPRWCEIMGVDLKHGLLNEAFASWLARIHPEHRSMVETTMSNHFAFKTAFEVDYLYEFSTGNFLWRRTIGQAIFSQAGKPIRMLGTAIDIDERKRFELQLQKSIQEVSDYKMALDRSAIVSISDPIGTIIYVNDKFCEQYGYKAEEVIGKNHRILNSGVHSAKFWKNFWKEITQGKVLSAEVCNKGKMGELHWSDTTIVPFVSDEGIPYQYLVIRNDITEKRKLEKELSEQQLSQQKLITEVALQEQEKERNELGRELHDNINQILATSKIYLGMARSGDGDINSLLENSFTHLNSAIEEIRRLSHNLVAPTLGDIGLHEAIQTLLGETKNTDSFEVIFEDDVLDYSLLDSKAELMLYRIIQEQLNNIRKHSQAKNVKLILKSDKNSLSLSIIDDGVGFDKSKRLSGIGLTNIQNRITFYAGTMQIETSPGNGCALNLSIPFAPKHTVDA